MFSFRIESDILKIKAEMDSMEKQLTGLMTKSEIGTSQRSVNNFINKVEVVYATLDFVWTHILGFSS